MKLLQIPATITKVSSMSNRVLRCQIDTQENLSDDQMGKIMAYTDKYGWFAFLPDKQIQEDDILDLPALPKKRAEDKKTPAEQLNNLLYIYWKQNVNKGEFELYYRQYMEKRCNEIREKIV